MCCLCFRGLWGGFCLVLCLVLWCGFLLGLWLYVVVLRGCLGWVPGPCLGRAWAAPGPGVGRGVGAPTPLCQGLVVNLVAGGAGHGFG